MNEIKALEFCEETLQLHLEAEGVFLSLAKRLKQIRDEKLFGTQWSSFGEFLNEMKLTEAKASRLITVYEKFVLGWGIDTPKLLTAGGWTNLYELGRFAKTKEEALEWIERRATAMESHFRESLRIARKGLEDCKHEEYYELRICSRCGHRERIFREDRDSMESGTAM